MSKTASIEIDVSFIDSEKYCEILASLLNNGWKANLSGQVVFMVNDSYEWSQASYDDFNSVITSIRSSIDQEKSCFIQLKWNQSLTEIELFYVSATDIRLNIIEDVRKINHFQLIDYSWYFERIAPIFSLIEFKAIRCVYS